MTSIDKYNKLANKHVFIIGGTSGIGFSVAEACLASGAVVTIASSKQEKIDSAIKRLPTIYSNSPKTRGFICDLSKPTIEQDLETLFEQVGKVDHIVLTAGDKMAIMPLQEVTLEKIIAAGQVRCFAMILVAKVGSRYLTDPRSPKCSIVFTSGSAVDRPKPGWSIPVTYGAGMLGLMRALAVDLKPVRVNCVSPGMVDTEIWESLGMSADEKKRHFETRAKVLLTGRIAGPDDVAEAYLYLMKDRNITGTCIGTDGGAMLE